MKRRRGGIHEFAHQFTPPAVARSLVVALLVVATTHAGAQVATTATAEPLAADPLAADPLAAAQSAMARVDQLRVVGATDPQRVLDLLARGTEALAQAKERLARDAPAPSTAPAGRQRRADASQTAAAAAAQRRLALCQIAFMQAELHRRTALALPQDHADRAALLDRALAQCKALRIEFRDIVAGRLGYVGEARVHRAKGDLAQADAVLTPVAIELDERRLAQQPPAVRQVQRVLWLERVETALARNASAGRALAAQLAQSPLIKEAAPAEQAALTWVLLQADADAILKGGGGDVAKLAEQVRDPSLAAAAPEHQRLALLVRLNGKQKGLLTPVEQLRWARLQSAAGLQAQALETYAAATAAAAPQDVSPADWHAYGSLLYASGRLDAAADALARGLQSLPPESPQRLAVIQAIAAGRLKAAREPGADEAKRKAAIDALWQLAEAAKDPAARRDALRSWAHLHQQAGTFEQQWLSLDKKFHDDVNADPYLCLLVSQARWRIVTATQHGPSTQPTVPPAELEREIRANLTRLLPQADADLAPSLVLLMAQAAAAMPDGARAALDVLAQHGSSLKPDAPATPQITGLRLRLLMELGLTAEAEALATKVDGAGMSTATALRLAAMLAERYAASDAAPPQQAKDQVVRLVSRGLAAHPHDAQYRASALDAARTLLKVKACADAQQILASLMQAGADNRKDPAAALLMAEAMQGQGKVEEAKRILDDVARGNPESGEVYLAAGRLQQRLQQWDAAASAYRVARKQLPAGGDAWWQATIGLADALAQQGNLAAAQDLLRVANAMYRGRAPASLLPRIDALLKQPPQPPPPVSTVDSRAGRNG